MVKAFALGMEGGSGSHCTVLYSIVLYCLCRTVVCDAEHPAGTTDFPSIFSKCSALVTLKLVSFDGSPGDGDVIR